ncbi:MAG: aldehyde dehydrogenase family protein, partial [Chitinophagaceae bacterium]|nr:aldehyde dehydrogenase family protein [Chitinophagaceae bacterium]
MHNFIQQLGIKEMNQGVSTGINWLASAGEKITSASPVDGKLIATVTAADKASY